MERIERGEVEFVLAFANLGRIKDPQKVYELLEARRPRIRVFMLTDEGHSIPFFPLPMKETGAALAAIFNRPLALKDGQIVDGGDLAIVDKLVQDLANNRSKARAAHGQRISSLVRLGALIGVPTFDKNRVQVELHYHGRGLQAACGYGLALLYDSSKVYGSALGRCPYERCDKWFLRLARNHGGRIPSYCSPECQRSADRIRAVERARTWRASRRETSR